MGINFYLNFYKGSKQLNKTSTIYKKNKERRTITLCIFLKYNYYLLNSNFQYYTEIYQTPQEFPPRPP